MTLKVVLESSDEGGFTVDVPSLPGCISEGDTIEEALRNIKEAIELYHETEDDNEVSKPIKETFLYYFRRIMYDKTNKNYS